MDKVNNWKFSISRVWEKNWGLYLDVGIPSARGNTHRWEMLGGFIKCIYKGFVKNILPSPWCGGEIDKHFRTIVVVEQPRIIFYENVF